MASGVPATFLLCLLTLLAGCESVSGSGLPSAPKPDTRLPAELRAQVTADLATLESMKGGGTTRLHFVIFGASILEGSRYLHFINERIDDFAFGDVCGSDLAMACFVAARGKLIWLTPNYRKFDLPVVYRLLAIVHEARHSDKANGYWQHVACPTPFLDRDGKDIVGTFTRGKLEGQAACDDVSQGAYGMNVVFLRNIQARCESCTEKIRQDAGFYADNLIERIIDKDAREELEKDD